MFLCCSKKEENSIIGIRILTRGGGGGGKSRRGFHANGLSERKNKKTCKFVLNKAELTSFAWSNLWSSSFIWERCCLSNNNKNKNNKSLRLFSFAREARQNKFQFIQETP